jgi:GntR family transcriptional regulator
MITELRLPRYREIEEALRERIAALHPGDPLPSDTALCSEFGVSRMTARNAMQRLADEGLVMRMPGRGSFVAQPWAHRRADELMSFSREMRHRGRRPSSRVLVREVRASTPAEAAALGVPEAEPVAVLRRLRLADDEPLAIETAVLVQRTAGAVMAADVETGSLHAALATAGIPLRRGTATISAEVATPDDVHLLGISRGAPLLVERRVIRDIHGRAIEATESRYPAERYALDVAFDMEDGSAVVGGTTP